ncbi:MAG: GFA family protein [Bdellovibrionales bacterium]
MQTHQGSCHCGKVRFEAELDPTQALACNCSMCGRKGTLLAFVPSSKFKLLSGEKNLTDYQFGRKVIHHTFCSTCGITAFASATAPDGTPMQAINVRCLDDIDLAKVTIKNFDGKSI